MLFEEENLQKRRILKAHEEEKSELYKQIGKLTTKVEWLKKNLHNSVFEQKCRELVSVAKRAEILGINRSTLYYKPKFHVMFDCLMDPYLLQSLLSEN